MPDDPLERDLAQRLHAYESRMPDADPPDVAARAPRRSIPWPLAAGGVLAAVAAGGLATLVLLNLPRANVGNDSPGPSAATTPVAGVERLALRTPRRDCVGDAEQLLAIYRIPDGEAFWTVFPKAGLAPEISETHVPLLVVVYDGLWPGGTFGGIGGSPRAAPAEGMVDVCVETLDGSDDPASRFYGVYAEIPLASSLMANAVASGSPEPTSAPSPPASIPSMVAFDGAVGTVVSWCWDGECVERSLDFEHPERYPPITHEVEFEATVTHLEAEAYASADERVPIEVTTDSSGIFISPSPSWLGVWRIVVVRAEFEGGGAASYAWRTVRGVRVGVGADHVAIYEPLVEVRPPGGPDDAEVDAVFEDQELLGIEGAIYFLKATDPQGTVVLDRMVSQDGDQERLPQGDYVLTAYFRTCDGNCASLGEAEVFCSVEKMLAPNESYRLVVSVSQRACEAG